ncbi:MAG: hypothetical protein L3J28_07900 [Candidatus Polarisedimenticolaceae bacterium]|nr:hypothetical protein [Candidatus Polarisedimenticolaceae bacterium]
MLVQNSIPAVEYKRAYRSIPLLEAVLFCLLLVPLPLMAAPGIISTNPLFLQTGVQPNLFFILDDSGSMDWEVLKSAGAQAAHPTFPNSGNVDHTPDNPAERLEFCAGYNVLGYHPNVEYTPWRGLDYSGNSFQDQNPSNAHVNPYTGHTNSNSCWSFVNNSNGSVCDLLTSWGGDGAFYFVWNDGDGDGVFDAGECPTGNSDRRYVSDLPFSASPGSPNSQTNYANWFSYYRKREYVMKRAVSQIIEESQVRMGLATINRRNRVLESTLMSSNKWEVGTPIMDIDDITAPIDLDAQSNKKILLDNLLAENSSGGTPLRHALNNTGRYFRGEMSSSILFDYVPPSATNSANGSSPILNLANGGQCQQNFALLFSDGYWNGSSPSGIGNTDQGTGPYDGASYADDQSNTLADVAMHYYENDLMPGLPNNVPDVTLDVGIDDNAYQHLVTFTIAFGVNGTVSCNPTDRDLSVSAQGYPSTCAGYSGSNAWPDPYTAWLHRVDDMRHAAWNGRGLFMSASDPQGLIEQLQAAIAEIASRTTAAAAAVAINAGHLNDGSYLYQAKFSSSRWSGNLSAFELTAAGVGDVQWEAHELLDSRSDPRMIITYNGSQGVNFEFPGNFYSSLLADDLSVAQAEDLLHDAPHSGVSLTATEQSENITYATDLADYLRGDRSNEGSPFRLREGRLGDIIHSSPRYVGAPSPRRYPPYIEGSSNSYMSWANGTVKNRTPMIYIGANDGMLHAFNANTGEERFAYIPQAVFSTENGAGLHWLADPAYEHLSYVDQTPTVMDVFIAKPSDPSASAKAWRTVLVGGLRSGGKSLFALDVTDPDDFSTLSSAVNNVLWEFSHPDLGYTFSQPAIVRLNNGDWAAIFGNGYNNDPSGDGVAKLFIVNLATGALVRSPLSTQVGSMVNDDCSDVDSRCNGLSTPAIIDTNGDSIIDRVYAGDLQGNMWVFDLSDLDPANWGSAIGSGTPMPLFTAVDTLGNPQPITTQPRLTKHTTIKSGTSRPNVMVFFGTGQYLTDSDTSNTAPQSFYAIWDTGSTTTTTRSNLLEQKITVHGGNRRTLSDDPITYGLTAGEHRGWYTDLSSPSGERVIVTPIIFGKLVVYTTIIPASNMCASAGTSWLMVHDLFDGGRPDYIAIDVDNDGNFDSDDQVAGINTSGVLSGDLQWQPSIVAGKIALPTDSQSGDVSDTVQFQGVSSGYDGNDVSWTRFNF